jgi:hypothetical protein
MEVQLQSWGEITDEIQHQSPTVEYAMEMVLKAGIAKGLTRSYLQNRDFYLVLMLRVMMNPHAVTPEKNMVVIPITANGKTLYATCFFRKTLPTPAFDESVWVYRHQTGEPQFLWNIPVKGMHEEYIRNYREYIQDPDKRRQAKTCMEFHTGELLAWIKRQNNEDPTKEGFFLKYNQSAEAPLIQ